MEEEHRIIPEHQDWNDFRQAIRDELVPQYATHYRREFYGLLLEDPSCVERLSRMQSRLEQRHGKKREYVCGRIYLETEQELIRKARRVFRDATTPGGTGFEVDWPGKSKDANREQSSQDIDRGDHSREEDWEWASEVDTPEAKLNRAAYYLEQSIQLSQRYAQLSGAIEVMDDYGVAYIEHWFMENAQDEPARRVFEKARGKQLEHLRTARKILKKHPDISAKGDFIEAAGEDRPGASIIRRVQDLGKIMMERMNTPSCYTGFDGGFQRLVEDIWRGDLEFSEADSSKRTG
jgi:hypothetical protein